MNILVTGAAGFLGGWMVKLLAEQGHTVIGWGRDERTTTLRLLGVPDHAILVAGDVKDSATWDRVIVRHRPEFILHLAAESQVRRALQLPREAWATNVMGTVEALEALRRHSDVVRGLVAASSDKAYGPARYLPYDEAHPLAASAPYDASKAAGDICARSYAATYNLPVAVIRCANIFGAADLAKDRIVPEVCAALVERRDVILRSDGSAERDYMYVADAVSAYQCVIEGILRGDVSAGNAFNFGTGVGTSVRSLVTELFDVAGEKDLKVQVGDSHPHTEIDRQILDSSKARKAFGWKPMTLREGLTKTWEWYKQVNRVSK